MEAYKPKGVVCGKRLKDGQIQYLVRGEGPEARDYWVGSDLLSSPEDMKEIKFFMV